MKIKSAGEAEDYRDNLSSQCIPPVGHWYEIPNLFLNVPRMRGQQLKDVSQLDGWLRDGSKDYIDSICKWD